MDDYRLDMISPDDPLGPTALAFGNFDGVHMGHRRLLELTRSRAAAARLSVTALTFEPHPLTLLRPDRAPRTLDTLAWRRHWLRASGADHVHVLRFDDQLRQRSATWFAEQILFGQLNARVIVVSEESRFGHRGQGDIALLRELAPKFGAEVVLCDPVVWKGETVSSSRVRRLVESGEIALASQLLARPFALRGNVVHGAARGRTLGFPTANLDIADQVRPAAGVYAGRLLAQEPGREPTWSVPAVCNLGVRPTVDGASWQAEAHAIDWEGDLYGQALSLELLHRIRGERRFESIEQLKEQIARDVGEARRWMGRRG